MLTKGSTVLFQGDSITDCDRLSYSRNMGMGSGYAMMAPAWFNAKYPHLGVKFINKGNGGDTTHDLVERWDTDCLKLKPDYVSILIGINDSWRRYKRNIITTVKQFELNYRKLLTLITDELDAKIIVMEPFLLHINDEKKKMRADLDPKIQVIRGLATEFKTSYIPLDGIFAKACTVREPSFWAGDGVHPTYNGHALIAREWLKAVEGI